VYHYDLNDLASKGLSYGHTSIFGHPDSSSITMTLRASKSISNSAFANLFGRVNANSPTEVSIMTKYEGDMSAEFADYYADVIENGELFESSDCTDISVWQCSKDDGGFQYSFVLYFDGTYSNIRFYKKPQ
jgi:hypothetical protein